MKEPINSTTKSDKNKKIKIVGIGVVFLLVVVTIVLVIVGQKQKSPPDYYQSERYEVVLDSENNYITLNPKPGVQHNSTLIFMHGYTGSSNSMFVGSPFTTAF